MAIRPIRTFGDPVLGQSCAPVLRFDDAVANLVTDLLDTCRLPGRAGLAAPQIGVSLRAFSYNIDGVEGYVVNPVLVGTEGEQDDEEGCLSIPGIYAPTRRAMWAKVTGVDVHGEPIEVEGEGLMGRCLQHEVDHLDGHLYIDRLGHEARREVLRELRNRHIG